MLRLVGLGYGDKAIALILGCAPATSGSHTKRIMSKLGAHNRGHACYLAFQRGLLTFDGDDIRVL